MNEKKKGNQDRTTPNPDEIRESATSSPPPITMAKRGGAQTPLDRFWIEAARNAAKESPDKLEEAAKQLITITSLSQAIYFAAISFSEIKKSMLNLQPKLYWSLVVAFIIPLLAWIASLIFAIRVFKPETYNTNLNSPSFAEEFMTQVTAHKDRQLHRAYRLLILGFALLLIAVLVYFVFIPVTNDK